MIGVLVPPEHPTLRQPVDEIPTTQEAITMFSNLAHTMVARRGVGLAAPQLGLPYALFVCRLGRSTVAFAKPRLVAASKKTTSDIEGCLSLPGVSVRIERPKAIQVKALKISDDGRSWRSFEMALKDMEARIWLHEYDHLQGVLITDYLPKEEAFLRG